MTREAGLPGGNRDAKNANARPYTSERRREILHSVQDDKYAGLRGGKRDAKNAKARPYTSEMRREILHSVPFDYALGRQDDTGAGLKPGTYMGTR
jgi:hypothetical protein